MHSIVGVEAGCAGGFAHVVGVERSGQAAAMLELGADRVVTELAELMARGLAG